MVDQFYYFGDMPSAGSGEEANYITHVRAGWEKFRELLPLLTSRVCSYKLKGRSSKYVLKVLYHIEVNYGS